MLPKIVRITREVTYEGTPEDVQKQMEHSLRDGQFRFLTLITVKTTHSDVPGLTGGNAVGWQPTIDL